MKVSLLSVGTRMPDWVRQGTEEYARRIKNELGFSLVEIPMPKRGKSVSVDKCRKTEAANLLAKLSPADFVVALEVSGKPLDTPGLSRQLARLREQGRNLSLLVGGPDGLDAACLQRADAQWSLSALTLPHPLVRIVVTEQLYRAASILQGHPYHRA